MKSVVSAFAIAATLVLAAPTADARQAQKRDTGISRGAAAVRAVMNLLKRVATTGLPTVPNGDPTPSTGTGTGTTTGGGSQ